MKFITLTTTGRGSSRRVNFDLVRSYEPMGGSTPIGNTAIYFLGDVKGAYPHYVTETVEQIDALLEGSPSTSPSIVLSLTSEDEDT